MSHANATLTPRTRAKIAHLVLERGYTRVQAAAFYGCSPATAGKWVRRYLELGEAGMRDRSSRPRSCPAKTPQRVVKRIVALRLRQRLGPAQIGWQLGMAASTVHAVLTRCRINRLRYLDRDSAEVLRYEHDHPGDLIHVDVTKFGNVPDGGGRRFLGAQQGGHNRRATAARTGAWTTNRDPNMGRCYVHTVIDDHSRIAYAEIHDDEKATTAIGVLQRAVAWFADHGVPVQRVLSDNGSAYISNAWKQACAQLGITHKRTRPYRPQTNGKIERFHRTLNDRWAYARLYTSERERRAALPRWLHWYNYHRAHTAIGGKPPITRLNNLPGHHNYLGTDRTTSRGSGLPRQGGNYLGAD